MTLAAPPGGCAVCPGDAALMVSIQNGSVHAFGELYARYHHRAYRAARAVSVDDGHAEEAVQEGFVSIWNSRATYRPELGTPAAWLLTVVRHRAIDIGRRAETHEARWVSDSGLEHCPGPEDVAAEAVGLVGARDLRALMARLPDAQREAIVLGFYGGLTHLEIADRLALPVGTVKGRIRLGLDKLRGEIEHAASPHAFLAASSPRST